MEIFITDIHPDDGLYGCREKLLGVPFEASITFNSTGISDQGPWRTIVGTFKQETGCEEVDKATEEEPVVIAFGQYSL
jgi:hypothetical protein